VILVRVDEALEECERHLTDTGTFGSQVEAILTAYCCSVAYAEFEKQVRRIVSDRGAGSGGDPHVASFVDWSATRLIRSIKISELAGIAARFHPDCKSEFHRLLDAQAQTAWDNILENRHDVAHSQTSAISNLTFNELKSTYPLALTVLDHLAACIAPAPATP
jgi:hypothetical protein